MTTNEKSRRDFLADSGRVATASWIALHLPWLTALASCAREDRELTHLTTAEASAMRAFAAQILPTDEHGPGAEEAGAVHFIDRALSLPFFAASVPAIHAGLADLDARAREAGAPNGFASLSSDRQIAIMRQIEHEPFFTTARTLVVIGTFADPSYGGNKDGTGWRLVGIDHRPSYQAPFGWYDAQPNANTPHTSKRVA
jgi:gluconate 2-dehydrogenase gamma chain